MTRRFILSVIATAILAALVLPAAAQAQKALKVRDAKGRLRGVVQYSDLFGADVKRRDGTLVGVLSSGDSGGGYIYTVVKGPGYVPPQSNLLGYVSHNRFYPPDQPNGVLSRVTGKVVRVGGRWVVKKKVGGAFRTVGTVPGACRGSYAMGAGRHLLW